MRRPAAGVPEGFGEALGEAIRHGMQQVRAVRVVESGAILASGHQLNISVADVLADEASIRLARDLQVQGLVAGTYSLDGDVLKVQAKIGDVRSDREGQVMRDPSTGARLTGSLLSAAGAHAVGQNPALPEQALAAVRVGEDAAAVCGCARLLGGVVTVRLHPSEVTRKRAQV